MGANADPLAHPRRSDRRRKGLPAIERVAALYSSDRDEGLAFADRIASELTIPWEQVVVAQIGPTVATYIGPGAMGIAVVEAVP